MLKAILFDLDGVLIDSPDWHFDALNKALGLFGMGISREEHVTTFNGLPTTTKINMLPIPAGLKPFIAEMKKKYTTETVAARTRPDYQKIILLRELSARYRLACVSNAIETSVREMLALAWIDSYFEFVIGNDNISRPKPDPEPYLYTMRVMGISPTECAIVEDAPYGLMSARASGARVIEVSGAREVNSGLFVREGLL